MGTDIFEKSGLTVKRTGRGFGVGAVYAFDAREAYLTKDELLQLIEVLEKEAKSW